MAEIWFEPQRMDSRIHSLNSFFYTAFSNEMRNYATVMVIFDKQPTLTSEITLPNKSDIEFSLGTKQTIYFFSDNFF